MKVLVTGGAGYIGSTTVAHLLQAGHDVLAFDSLFMGHREAVPSGAEFFLGDLADEAAIEEVFRSFQPEAVLHFASHTMVGESMEKPFAYLSENVRNALNLLQTMDRHGVQKIVLSSTANLFDQPERQPIAETESIIPGSPYGESKAIIERFLYWLNKTKGLRYGCLRYFNAAGATEERGEDHTPETHIIPLILQVALGQREQFTVYGDDYETPDGTCVRDYIHIKDLASAHCLALEALEMRESVTYNLGNGRGHSILEVIQAARAITNHRIPTQMGQRRPGDPATLVADSQRIRDELGWDPVHSSLESILKTAWQWHRDRPSGFTS